MQIRVRKDVFQKEAKKSFLLCIPYIEIFFFSFQDCMKNSKNVAISGSQDAANKATEISNLFMDMFLNRLQNNSVFQRQLTFT